MIFYILSGWPILMLRLLQLPCCRGDHNDRFLFHVSCFPDTFSFSPPEHKGGDMAEVQVSTVEVQRWCNSPV